MAHIVLVINPGSTSDEVAVFADENLVFHETVRHLPKTLEPYEGQKVTVQFEFRKNLVLNLLLKHNIKVEQLSAVIGRGGLIKPIPSGTYIINTLLLNDLTEGIMGDHPSNLGGLIAHNIAYAINKPAFIADPVVVDELSSIAKYSGMPENPRMSIFHALNQKRVARLTAEKLCKKYEDCKLIVLHAGGGISVGLHVGGKVVDVNNALNGDGPFTPQRSGGIPAAGLVKMCFSGKYTEKEINLKLKGKGGLIAYTGTADVVMLERYVKGEQLTDDEQNSLLPNLTKEKASEIVQAMSYQVAKEICALTAYLKGYPDAIVLTGGIAYSKDFACKWIKERVEWLAPVYIFPGGDEMSALRDAALRILRGQEEAKNYIHSSTP